MTVGEKLYIAGTGLMTCVGGTAEQSLAAIKAGVSMYGESPVLGKDRAYLTMALVPDEALPPLDKSVSALNLPSRHQRMLRLAAKPLLESLAEVPAGKAVPLFLALPESLPGMRAFSPANFVKYLLAQSGAGSIDASSSRCVATGRAGGLQALDLAFRYLQVSGQSHALIGGVDTFLDLYNHNILDQQGRVKCESAMDGFVPGEAAAFVLLSTAPPGGQKTATVFCPGLAEEAGHYYSETAYTGDGLARAMRSAIANGPGGRIRKIFCSMNGEHFGAKEFGVASIRNSASFEDDMVLEHPADCIGDVGAAFAPILLAQGGRENATNSLVYCSSDLAYRGAACVTTEVNR